MTDFVTRIHGQLPIIITAPHGGLLKPDSIPDRVKGTSPLLADMHTMKIATLIGHGLESHYQASPHILLNKISRRKADVNRSREEGAETPEGEEVWDTYHNNLQEIIDSVINQYEHGLLIDIHGQTHTHEQVELGYLLEHAQLTSDELEHTILNASSIQSLAKRTSHPISLLMSFGDSLLSHSIPATPSTVYPVPDEIDYFSGGYTTCHYSNQLDIIQIEIPKHLRFDDQGQKSIIDAIVYATTKLIDHYYLMKSKI
ncbi:hypothetical protein BDB01DRAFT_839313 [Pilobolus umbonatus]|nr:hypothetical protein BDB01DRAFT_839313 [Pilobolus umbonatus]